MHKYNLSSSLGLAIDGSLSALIWDLVPSLIFSESDTFNLILSTGF